MSEIKTEKSCENCIYGKFSEYEEMINEFDWERLADRMKEEGLKVERYKPEPEENISD